MEKAPSYEFGSTRLSDLDGIVAIENVSFPTPWPRRVLEREILSNKYFNEVLRFGGMVVGYVFTWTVLDEIHILNIAVHPDFRNMGLGEKIMRSCLGKAAAKGLNIAILEVRVSNLSARTLYEKLGFRIIHTRRKYYSDTGEDAYVMMYDLKKKGA
ncbi:MAG: ribosomal protein S18-alanine N-acetyltransferase [Candidatus Dadabacteria bacterium]|jgi:[ribosomal protein S18]-alanine N-acetyltransferase|nr:ribosomal protein S18-alanine N-acetyltransferase [Candidatus Dadabacteria bacterium]